MRLALILVLFLAATPLGSAEPTPVDFDDDVRAAVDRGLEYLASTQRPNGSWTCKIGYKLFETYNGEDGEHVGITSLAGMAFLSAGHVPGRGKYARTVERGLAFVLSCVRAEDGYISSNGTRMYSHAFATTFLSQIYGMAPRNDVKRRLKRAVALLEASQNKEGGWRYSPMAVDADLSVTVTSLQALRAARNVGIAVPLSTIDRATRYVGRCARRSGFSYQPRSEYFPNDSRITFPLAACGIVSMYSAGLYGTKEVRSGIRSLEIRRSQLRWSKYHYFYGHYYAAQAMYIAGPDRFGPYYRRVRREVLGRGRQLADGGWSDDVGRNYATAMACIVLQMPCELFPLFQK